jgi:6-phosphofructokinase 1
METSNSHIRQIAIITSGGDVPGLNACIRAIVLTCAGNGIQAKGVQHGFEGLISGDFIPLNPDMVFNIIQLGGTILKSSRSERFRTRDGRRQAYNNIKSENIDAVVLIGGDGSFQGAKAFIEEYDIPFIGIPKTIDNDISGTDMCIGYDTALNTAMDAIDKVRDTAQSHDRIFIIEVMGRDSGFIAYGAGIAGGAEAVMLLEMKGEMDKLKQVLLKYRHSDKSLIIVVAEGDEEGGALKIAENVKEILPSKYIGVCTLGHIQRGGSPSAADRILATKLGFEAVEAIVRGQRNLMIGINGNSIQYTPLNQITQRSIEIHSPILRMITALTNQ